MVIVKYKDGASFKRLNPFVTNLSYKKVLDQYGDFSFDYPLGDSKVDNLTKRREIQIFYNETLLYSGFITNISDSISSPSPVRTIQGVGLMEEFANEVTVPNILYVNEPYTDILDPTYVKTLVRPTTWSTVVEPTAEDLSYLFSLQSSLKTFSIINRQLGYHFRYIGTSGTPRRLEFGVFGSDSGVRVRKKPIDRNSITDDYLVIEENGLTQIEDSLNVINYIYPVGGGGGNGLNQLTLRDTDPLIVDPSYPVNIDPEIPNTDADYPAGVYSNTKTGPNNNTCYYMSDPASIAVYGTIKRSVVFNDLFPNSSNKTSYSDADRQIAANELYKAAKQYLIDNKDAQVSYSLSALGNAPSLNVGDKINLKFKGEINRIDETETSRVFANIDEDLFVVSMQVEILQGDMKRYTLEVSNLPKLVKSDSDVVGSIVETVNDYGRQRKGSVTTYPVYFDDSFDNSYPAKFLFWIPNETIFTNYIKLKVRLRQFRAYSKAVAGGGAVTQSTSSGGATTPTTNSGGGAIPTTSGGGSHSHYVSIPSHTHGMFLNIAAAGTYGANANVRYRMGSSIGQFEGQGGSGSVGGGYATSSGGGAYQSSTSTGWHTHTVNVPNHTHTVSIPDHTHNVTLPNHTHSLSFGIYEYTTPPTNVRIYVDGHNYSSELGTLAAFGYYPAGDNASFDLLEAAANLGYLDELLTPGTHEIQVRCSSGRAKVELAIFNQFYISSK